jgi:glycosyltransferase involved in cell wall biosynthesis
MITLLIITHDEEEKIIHNLPLLLSQQGADYEIVVVDMNSEDNTLELLNTLEENHKHLRHLSLPTSARDISRERLALHLGMRAANSKNVLILRPGTQVPDEQWLANVEKRWRTDGDIMLIPTKRVRNQKGRDFFTAGHEAWHQALNFKQARKYNLFRAANNVVGLNKDKFLTYNSPAHHLALKTGTLDIFISHTATVYNTIIITETSLVPYEEPIKSSHLWAQMRLFDVETRKHLTQKSKWTLTYILHCITSIHKGSIPYSIMDAYDYLRWSLTRKKTFIKKHY